MSRAPKEDSRFQPHFARRDSSPAFTPKGESASHFDGILNTREILTRAGHNAAVLSKIIHAFNTTLERYVQDIDGALKNRDLERLTHTACQLKNAIQYFSMKSPYEAAHKLELFGKNNQLAEAMSAFSTLKQQIYVLQFELSQLEHAQKNHLF